MIQVYFIATGTTTKQHLWLEDDDKFLCKLRRDNIPARFENYSTDLVNAFHQTGISGLGLEHDRYLCLRCLKHLRKLYIEKMTNPTYLELKKAVIEHLSQGDPYEVCLYSESGEWTRQQLIEAVHQNHYEGIKMVSNLVKLSLDLVLRGKEKLHGFEIRGTGCPAQ